jgi:hypothetical protein
VRPSWTLITCQSASNPWRYSPLLSDGDDRGDPSQPKLIKYASLDFVHPTSGYASRKMRLFVWKSRPQAVHPVLSCLGSVMLAACTMGGTVMFFHNHHQSELPGTVTGSARCVAVDRAVRSTRCKMAINSSPLESMPRWVRSVRRGIVQFKCCDRDRIVSTDSA